jgi:hypothetical protein
VVPGLYAGRSRRGDRADAAGQGSWLHSRGVHHRRPGRRQFGEPAAHRLPRRARLAGRRRPADCAPRARSTSAGRRSALTAGTTWP